MAARLQARRSREGRPDAGRRDASGMGEGPPRRGILRRLGWFAGLWLASVAALAVVAYAIRFWLGL